MEDVQPNVGAIGKAGKAKLGECEWFAVAVEVIELGIEVVVAGVDGGWARDKSERIEVDAARAGIEVTGRVAGTGRGLADGS